MTRKTFLLAFMWACSPAMDDSGSPIEEEWSCSHQESRFSANVEAVTPDMGWDAVDFFIHDADEGWTLPMVLEDGVWTVRAALYDLDCNSDALGAYFDYVD